MLFLKPLLKTQQTARGTFFFLQWCKKAAKRCQRAVKNKLLPAQVAACEVLPSPPCPPLAAESRAWQAGQSVEAAARSEPCAGARLGESLGARLPAGAACTGAWPGGQADDGAERQ